MSVMHRPIINNLTADSKILLTAFPPGKTVFHFQNPSERVLRTNFQID